MKRIIMLVVPLALIALVATSALATAKSNQANVSKSKVAKIWTNIKGEADYPKVKGKAFFEAKGQNRRLRVHIMRAKIVAGETLDVFVGTENVGSISVKSAGEGKLDIISRRGHTVPNVVSGDTLELRTSTPDVVATGKFSRK